MERGDNNQLNPVEISQLVERVAGGQVEQIQTEKQEEPDADRYKSPVDGILEDENAIGENGENGENAEDEDLLDSAGRKTVGRPRKHRVE